LKIFYHQKNFTKKFLFIKLLTSYLPPPLVRLACLIHAASVHPGPRSNPHKKLNEEKSWLEQLIKVFLSFFPYIFFKVLYLLKVYIDFPWVVKSILLDFL